MIKILTSGDSHGYGLFGIVEGFPAHFKVDIERIDRALFSRQHVYGRGQRMKLESDHIQILSGLWEGETTGAPLTFFIKNRSTTSPNGKSTAPRPGHADFAGMIKYDFEDARVTTERSSSRRTAMDVAIGEFFRDALEELGVKIWAYTQSIGNVESKAESVRELSSQAHPLLCPDNEAEKMMMGEIDEASKNGYTLGGKVKALVQGLPVGLGSFNSYENRLTSLIAESLFDIPSVKGVVYGDIDKTYKLNGVQAMDEINIDGQRKTNHAGGIEGGMSNGEKIEVTLFVKPVPTQRKGLKTVDFKSDEAVQTSYVRSDTCVVGAVSIIAQAKLSTVIFKEMINEFGGSTFREIKERVENYRVSRKWGIFREKK